MTENQADQPVPPAGAPPGEIRELRIALVCYGGVSLSIYMHGMTREIHHLVEASCAFVDQPEDNPYPEDDVRYAYFEALRARRAREDGVRTRVVVDTISGSSAGGINGIILAKVLAHGLRQDALRDLWLDKGDIGQLIGWRALPWLPLKGVAWLLTRWFHRPPSPPLSGDRMFRWVYDALQAMDRTGSPERTSLMPQGHRLELFVTTTDFYGYQRLLPMFDPASAPDTGHRHVLTFAFQEGTDTDQFGSDHNPALTFAARATSSFPGAFPPIEIADISRTVEGWKPDGFAEEFFSSYVSSGGDPAETSFLDGGVLDNKPFGHAVRAVQHKPAWFEVQRRLLYIQPDPNERFKPPRGRRPGWLSTIWSGLSTLPREEPVLDDLLEVRGFNERVMRVQDMVRRASPVVEERVRKRLGAEGGDLRAAAFGAASVDWRTRVNDLAKEEGGLHYIAYARLKLSAVVEQLGLVAARLCGFPDDTDQSMFVRDVVREWGWRKPDILAAPFGELSPRQEDFLRAFDLGYGYRRLRFVSQGVNALYDTVGSGGHPDRAGLNALKLELAALAARMERVLAGGGLGDATGSLRELFPAARVNELLRGPSLDYPALADRWEPELDALRDRLGVALNRELQGFGEVIASRLEVALRNWDREAADAVLTRYLGFPLWDALIYPVLKLADVGELVPVAVFRLSPADATRLDGSGSSKLFGVRRSHFGAFFRRMWRESDYLWGRLDGMERMLDLVGEQSAERYGRGFRAILTQERDSLKTLGSRFRDLEEKISTL